MCSRRGVLQRGKIPWIKVISHALQQTEWAELSAVLELNKKYCAGDLSAQGSVRHQPVLHVLS
jgi:hypothetical protein